VCVDFIVLRNDDGASAHDPVLLALLLLPLAPLSSATMPASMRGDWHGVVVGELYAAST
jgi:hypothetical protein